MGNIVKITKTLTRKSVSFRQRSTQLKSWLFLGLSCYSLWRWFFVDFEIILFFCPSSSSKKEEKLILILTCGGKVFLADFFFLPFNLEKKARLKSAHALSFSQAGQICAVDFRFQDSLHESILSENYPETYDSALKWTEPQTTETQLGILAACKLLAESSYKPDKLQLRSLLSHFGLVITSLQKRLFLITLISDLKGQKVFR